MREEASKDAIRQARKAIGENLPKEMVGEDDGDVRHVRRDRHAHQD